MERKIKILHFEKNIDSDLIESTMKQECINCELRKIYSAKDFINELKTEVFDVILSENSDELISAFRLAKEISPHSAFIVVSTNSQESIKGQTNGRTEFDDLPNTSLKVLAPAINKVVEDVFQRHDISCHWG